MKDQTFEQFARAWIYLLSSTENKLALVPLGSDFAFEFKWTPKSEPSLGEMASGDPVPTEGC